MAEEVISRAEARARGLVHYFTGSTCKHGHLSPRYVYNTKCVVCISGYHARNKEKRNQRSRERAGKGRDLQNYAQWLARTKERRSLRMKEYNAIPENKARKTAITKIWQDKNKDSRRSHYLQNREEILRKQKAYRAKNRDAIYKQIKEWRSHNREALKAQLHRRRALKRNALGFHTAQDLKDILRLQKNKCANCRAKFHKNLVPTLDHIIALINGGSNDRKNLQFLCGPCNSSKKERDPIAFYRSQGMLL